MEWGGSISEVRIGVDRVGASPERHTEYLANFAAVAYRRGKCAPTTGKLPTATQLAHLMDERCTSARHHLRRSEKLG